MSPFRKPLSDRQVKILQFIKEYLRENQYPPSIRDIQAGCDISSTSVVDYNLHLLQRAGAIKRSPERARGIELLDQDGEVKSSRSIQTTIPVIGSIAAGQPLPVFADGHEGLGLDTVDIPSSFLLPSGTVFALRVRGKSMIDALIDDGDIVLIEQGQKVENGDMVAAWLINEREATLKKFYAEDSRIRLQPANSQMNPIYVDSSNLEVQGKVVGVIRLPSKE